VDGGTGYWVEVTMNDQEAGGEVIYKSLFVVAADQMEVKKVIFQMPGEPPMEMPMGMMQMGGRQAQSADIRKDKDVVLVGTESVTTPAGTFNCQHYRSTSTGSVTWVATGVAPYGLVKSVSKDGETMVLTRVLSSAKTKITGAPQPFDPMQMMRQRPDN
jgi:hypothetical protein